MPCGCSLSLSPLLYFGAPALFLLVAPFGCVSLAVLLSPASPSPPLLSASVRYPLPVLLLPVTPSSRLPAFSLDSGCGTICYLLTSPSAVHLRFSMRGLLFLWVSSLIGIPFARCTFSLSLVSLPLALPLSLLGSFYSVLLSTFGFFLWLRLLVPSAL